MPPASSTSNGITPSKQYVYFKVITYLTFCHPNLIFYPEPKRAMHASSQAISHASNQFDQSTPSVNAELESYHATTDIDNGDVGVGGELFVLGITPSE